MNRAAEPVASTYPSSPLPANVVTIAVVPVAAVVDEGGTVVVDEGGVVVVDEGGVVVPGVGESSFFEQLTSDMPTTSIKQWMNERFMETSLWLI